MKTTNQVEIGMLDAPALKGKKAAHNDGVCNNDCQFCEDNLVPRSAACPNCGERNVDHLILHEDDTVFCSTCATNYSIVPITP